MILDNTTFLLHVGLEEHQLIGPQEVMKDTTSPAADSPAAPAAEAPAEAPREVKRRPNTRYGWDGDWFDDRNTLW